MTRVDLRPVEPLSPTREALLRLCRRAMALEPGTEEYAIAWADVVTELDPQRVAELVRRADRADEADAFFAYARKALGL